MKKKTRTIFNLHSFFLSIISFRHLRRTLATRIKHKKKKKRKFGTISVNIYQNINKYSNRTEGEKKKKETWIIEIFTVIFQFHLIFII